MAAMQINVAVAVGTSTLRQGFPCGLGFTTITLDVNADDTILTVKAKIQDITDISPSDQILIFMSETLDNARTLAHYNVSMGAKLFLNQEWADLILHVVTNDGQRFIVDDITAPDRIVVIKIRIRQMTGIPENRQRLMFRGFQLAEYFTLADYGVRDGDTIYLATTAPSVIVAGTAAA
jgi:hypothetical protein